MSQFVFESRARLVVAVVVLLTARAAAHDPFPPATPESVGLSAAALAELAAAVEGYVEKELAVGIELLVIKDRRTVLHEAFGWRDVERQRPMERHTICNIRSMTKPVTGAAIQILVDRGLVGLDDSVAKHIPSFDSDRSRAITVRQLLEHRSGLPLTALMRIDQYPDLLTLAEAVGRRGPQFEPDSKFWYSDAGSDVLAAIVEAVTGDKVDAFVERELLQPLGMRDSLYLLDMSDPRAERVSSLYGGRPGAWVRFWAAEPGGRAFYPFAWGSQTLYSTPMDYAKLLAMWMDGGTSGGRRVLSEAAVARTLAPSSPMSTLGSDDPYPTFYDGLRAWYGRMAIVYLDENVDPAGAAEAEPVIIGHSGSDGTSALAWPARDLMVLCFTQSRGGLAVLRLQDEIERLILYPERAASGPLPAHLEPYLGTYVANYGHFRNAEFTVLARGETLAVDVPGQLVFTLRPPDDEGR
ncbi:MAG: serine hydrolase domain-containing protein, partial [Planctomycetota bacterium]